VGEGNAVAFGDWRAVGVVRDDDGDVHGQFADVPAIEQVDQAVIDP
jgi:hypothetical protein